jgi:ParB-like chromosome segregation protein Spo0J
MSFGQRPGQIATVELASLHVGLSIREQGPSGDHGPLPMTEPETWEPILVSCSRYEVVDGHRRVRAALVLGATELRVRWFVGDEIDAIAEFVRLNTRDDNGLSRTERQEAARRILRIHADWSDRRIGEICKISPKIVAQLRSVLGESAGGHWVNGTDARVGRDGRVRPLDSRAQRIRIAEAIKAHPRASLRSIAGPIGASPETVRRVRTAVIEQGALDRDESSGSDALRSVLVRMREPTWKPDEAFMSRDDAAEVAAFVARTDTSGVDPEQQARAIPLSRVYEIADEARRRAAFWVRFAESVEKRSQKACL